MSAAVDLVARLRRCNVWTSPTHQQWCEPSTALAAADLIEQQAAEIDRLRTLAEDTEIRNMALVADAASKRRLIRIGQAVVDMERNMAIRKWHLTSHAEGRADGTDHTISDLLAAGDTP